MYEANKMKRNHPMSFVKGQSYDDFRFAKNEDIPIRFGTVGNTANFNPPTLDYTQFSALNNKSFYSDTVVKVSPKKSCRSKKSPNVKQTSTNSREFRITSEDFPALPRQRKENLDSSDSSTCDDVIFNTSDQSTHDKCAICVPSPEHAQKEEPTTEEKSTHEETSGTILKDQYGMAGLLEFLYATEKNEDVIPMTVGYDLTNIGLNLNSSTSLHSTFAGPWSNAPCRPQDIDENVPMEYRVNALIRDKLHPIKLNRYSEDTLFYLFYTYVGDVIQIATAAELYNRNWRYHMEERMWFTNVSGLGLVEKTSTYERGTYKFFEPQSWSKITREYVVEYAKVEGKPQFPTQHY